MWEYLVLLETDVECNQITLSVWGLFQTHNCTCNHMLTFGFSVLASYVASAQCASLVVPPFGLPTIAVGIEPGSVLPFLLPSSRSHIPPTHCPLPSSNTTLHTHIKKILWPRGVLPFCRLFSFGIRLQSQSVLPVSLSFFEWASSPSLPRDLSWGLSEIQEPYHPGGRLIKATLSP